MGMGEPVDEKKGGVVGGQDPCIEKYGRPNSKGPSDVLLGTQTRAESTKGEDGVLKRRTGRKTGGKPSKSC